MSLKKTPIILFTIAAFCCQIAGCLVPSKNPFYNRDDLVFDEALVGTWITSSDPQHPILISRSKAGDGYDMIVNSEKESRKLRLYLMKLGEYYFLDVVDFPEASPGHLLVRVSFLGQNMRLRFLSDAWLERELKSGRARVKHEFRVRDFTTTVNGRTERHSTKEMLLTASTEDLQAFLLDHLDDPTAFGRAGVFRRARKIEVAPAGLASKRQRTLEYWCVARAVALEANLPPEAKPEQIAQELTRMAKEIEDLPTLGVDLIASDCALEMASTFNRMSDYVKSSQSGERMFEAAVRGFFGDPLGVANEVAAEHKSIGDQLKSSIEKCKRGRVILTDRYGVEFTGVK